MLFEGECKPIPQSLARRMRGVSWHETLPGGFVGLGFAELRLLTVSHWNFEYQLARGELIVASQVADAVLDVFAAIFEARFPIAKLRLIDEYGADDERSMADNNSSAFNCRLIGGTTRPSRHALGLAIDLNPVQNPYIVRGNVHPKAALTYVDRADLRPGMLSEGDSVVSAFARIGWTWGGTWHEPKDYHHFELSR
ncbi:MAG TPA: M15 family metallopeptidase [Polyangiaceae bacterium]|nr:M15 family metallopeptidase [Polyangiaceae bacterium]